MLRCKVLSAWLAFIAIPISSASLFQPDLQSLQWSYNGTQYWSPIDFNATAFKYTSISGPTSSSLDKRDGGVSSGKTMMPCTVLNVNTSTAVLNKSILEESIKTYGSLDDVWNEEQFLECLLIQQESKTASFSIDPTFLEFLSEKEVNTVFLPNKVDFSELSVPSEISIRSVASECNFSNGPYVVALSSCDSTLSLSPVYTLHSDTYEAFMEGAYQGAIPDSFLSTHVSIPGSRLPAIITPSRLSSKDGPLSGLRFAVKDIFHIKGMKTSGGSRSYYQTYGPQNYTTETVQLALDGGASMLGKTRSIAFALGAPVNGLEVDYMDPWNSRGDGYQSTGGSSTGSGAAVTAYDWIDFAIGSDTGGSVRFPARYGGIYGYKPTHGVFNLTGILVAIAEQDTPGLMARSPSVFTKVGRQWLSQKSLATPSTLPSNLLYYADPDPVAQPAAAKLIQEFFSNTSAALDMTTSSINITSDFLSQNISQTSPPQDIPTFMYYVYSDQNSVEGWDKIGKHLAADYALQNNGAFPPADPPVNISWTDGQNSTTRSRFPKSQRRREVFADFFNKDILPPSNETCSQSILAHSYHTAPTTVKSAPNEAVLTIGWYSGVAMNYAGVPEIVVPIGQIKYWSPYTRTWEWQPVTVALAAAKGCDTVLFDLVDKLAQLGLLKEVMAGKVAFPVD